MEITNPGILTAELNKIAEKVIFNVSAKTLDLLRDRIMKDTYGSHNDNPNRYYLGGSKEPSYQFLDAWKWHPIEKAITSISRELFYDYLSMVYSGEFYHHGSPLEDRREELANDLNILGKDLNNDWGGKNRLPFWNNFLWELMEENQIGKWFDEELFKFGFIKT